MNLLDETVQGVNQLHITDSMAAPLLKLSVEVTGNTILPVGDELVIYVDKNNSSNPTSDLRQYTYDLEKKLDFLSSKGDKFILEIKPCNNDIILEAKVERWVGDNEGTPYLLNDAVYETLDSFPICLFDGDNYIYTNYNDASIEVIYTKDDDSNKMFLANSIYYNHKIKNDGEFSLEDIYFKDAFTKTQNKLNLEVDSVDLECITSKNNAFSLDSEGNLVVKSVTSTSGSLLNFDAIYPIGSIYFSVNNVNPGSLFGGTWEQIKDKFLLSSGDTYSAGATGGEATHLLTTSEIPSHNHTFTQSSCTNPGNHTHIVGADKDGGAGSNRYTVHITGNNTANGQQYSPASGAAGGHTHTINGSISNTGGSTAHNNMPPYLVVYVWKRIA